MDIQFSNAEAEEAVEKNSQRPLLLSTFSAFNGFSA
jgi:hypothetical protein